MEDTKSLEDSVSDFDPEEYRKVKKELDQEYRLPLGGGTKSSELKAVRSEINREIFEEDAKTKTDIAVIQNLYVGFQRLIGRDGKSAVDAHDRRVEAEIEDNIHLLETIDQRYLSKKREMESLRNRLGELSEKKRKDKVAIRGINMERQELDQVLKARHNGGGPNYDELVIVGPDVSKMDPYEISEKKDTLEHQLSHAEIDLSRTYMNIFETGGKLKETEQIINKYKMDRETVMGGIVGLIEDKIQGSVHIGELLDTSIIIAEHAESSEDAIVDYNKVKGAALKAIAKYQDKIFSPYRARSQHTPEGVEQASRTLESAMNGTVKRNAASMDKLEVMAEAVENQYLSS